MTDQSDPARPTAYWPGYTAREHAAIQLRVPNSGTDWLDAMIRQSLRVEFAKAAMPALVPDHDYEKAAHYAVAHADALTNLLAELEKGK